jgi:hypothetical protein
MSSTEHQLAMLEKFYEDKFNRAAEQIIAQGITVFPLAPDPYADSYYSKRDNTRVRFTDSGSDLSNPEALLTALGAQQHDSQREIMVPLMRSILELASEFDQAVEQDAEVSTLIYVMF